MAQSAGLTRRLLAVAFLDVARYSELMERDESGTHASVEQTFDQVVNPAVRAHAGKLVDRAGDGLLLSFQSSTDAVKCALAIQGEMAMRNRGVEAAKQIQLRIGVNVGDIIVDGDRVVGDGVNVAARLETIAHPGGICISASVREQLREELNATIYDLGNISIKNIARPIRAYRVQAGSDVPHRPPIGSPEHVYQLLHPQLRQDVPVLRSVEGTNNLPRQVTSFIGRQRELTEAKRLLMGSRLLTLVGVAGIGKTRLALQLAADVIDGYSDGVWFADLAPIADPTLVVNVVAQVLGVQEHVGRSVVQTLLTYLEPRRLLLILDNCEHVIEACARLADSIVHASAQVRIVATSREALHITGEQTYLLPSLSLPDSIVDPEALGRSDAVQLFLERARSRRPDFALNERISPVIAEICTRLDGMPLALELAAARIESLTVEKIAERLSDRFRLLTGGSRTALPRQQTLRALIDWSYDLLDDLEATLFARLSVFAGGWTIEAAEMIGAGGAIARDEVLDLMASLVQKSLVVMEEKDDRYRMLDSIRHYAQERLLERGEGTDVRGRLVDYCLNLVENAEPALRKRSEEEAWLHRLDVDYENIKLTLEWCLKDQASSYSALRLCAALLNFWSVRGHWREARTYCCESLARNVADTPAELRGKVLLTRAVMAFFLGEFDEAQDSFEEALSIGRNIGNRALEVGALSMLGGIVLDRGDLAEAQAFYQQAVMVNREVGNYAWESIILTNLGHVFLAQDNPAAARAPLERALKLSQELDNRSLEANALSYLGLLAQYNRDLATASALVTRALTIFRALGAPAQEVEQLQRLGEIAMARGEPATASGFFRDALVISRNLGFRDGILRCLNAMVALAVMAGAYGQGATFTGGRDALAEAMRTRSKPSDSERFDLYRERCRTALGAVQYEAEYQAGHLLSTDAMADAAFAWLVHMTNP